MKQQDGDLMIMEQGTDKPVGYTISDADAKNAYNATVPGNVDNKTPEVKKVSRTQEKKTKREQKRMKKTFGKFMVKQARRQESFKGQLERLKEAVGKKEFELLKTLATVSVPEQKNEKGEVTQAASSYIHYDLLFAEGKNMVTILRESRMKAGTRKRTSGSHSKRKAHKSKLAAINERNKILENLSKQAPAQASDVTAQGGTNEEAKIP